MDKIINKENITFILSLFGSFGVILGWILTYIKNRKNISLKIIKYGHSPKGLLTYIEISNQSRLPISINEISVSIGKDEYRCSYIPVVALERTNRAGNKITNIEKILSMTFPVNIQPLCGYSGYVYFPSFEENFPDVSNTAFFVVHTNRGKKFEKELSLGVPLD